MLLSSRMRTHSRLPFLFQFFCFAFRPCAVFYDDPFGCWGFRWGFLFGLSSFSFPASFQFGVFLSELNSSFEPCVDFLFHSSLSLASLSRLNTAMLVLWNSLSGSSRMTFSLGAVSTGFRHLGRKRVILAFHVASISGLGSEHLELICQLSFSFFPFFFFKSLGSPPLFNRGVHAVQGEDNVWQGWNANFLFVWYLGFHPLS